MKLFRGLFGGGSEKPHQSAAVAAPAGAKSTITGAGVAPGTSADDFRKQQESYWNQLLSGTGQSGAGGGLPQGVQSNIEKQAALLSS